jgi:hypothetical protein
LLFAANTVEEMLEQMGLFAETVVPKFAEASAGATVA